MVFNLRLAILSTVDYIRSQERGIALNIIIAGGTGFVGSSLARKLIESGNKVTLIVRPGTDTKSLTTDKSVLISADPGEALDHIHAEADVLINAIGIIKEFPHRDITFKKIHVDITNNLLEFAKSNGINRFIQISALGVGPDSETEYQRSKFESEEHIRQSGLNWTILRPSMIIGPGDHVTGMFSGMIKRLPVVPVIGDGNYTLQPVHIDDITTGIIGILDNDRAFGKTYEIGGPEVLAFNEILDLIGRSIGKKRVRKFHQPVSLMRIMASVLGRFAWFPVTGEQITMLLQGNSTTDTRFFDLRHIKPISFTENLTELK